MKWIYLTRRLMLLLEAVHGFQLSADHAIQGKANNNSDLIQKQCIVFEDHFDRFDLKNWQHEITMSGGGNWEFQWYANNRSNSFVEDGILYIKPTLTADFMGEGAMTDGGVLSLWSSEPSSQCTDNSNYGCERVSGASSGGNYINPIQSARIRTINSMSIRYGKVQVRARLPRGDWLWPAIWMMPKYSTYGVWPASGEIDIMESRGNHGKAYPYGDSSRVRSTLHWGPHSNLNSYNLTQSEVIAENGTFADDFHTYALEWNEEGLRTTIDNKTVLQVDFDQSFWQRGAFPDWCDNPWKSGSIGAPFDEEFYLIFNLAVGGASFYWPDHETKPWSNSDPHPANQFWNNKKQWLPSWGEGHQSALAIDWVKVWSDLPC